MISSRRIGLRPSVEVRVLAEPFAVVGQQAARGVGVQIAAFDAAAFDEPSTKAAAKLVADWGAQGSILVVLHDSEERAALSFRNLDQVRAVLPVTGVGVVDVIAAANVLASPQAIDALTARATGEPATQEEAA